MLLVHALSCDCSYHFAYTCAACTKSNKPQLGENVLEALAPKALDTGAHGRRSHSNLVSSILVKSCLPLKFSASVSCEPSLRTTLHNSTNLD